MKLVLNVILIVVYTFKANSQLSIDYLKIVTSSANYTYIGIKYKPDYNLFTLDTNLMNNALASMQARYNAAHDLCSHEYQKIMRLQLINVGNKKILNNFQRECENWSKRNYSNIDLSINSNRDAVLKYFTSLYSVESIKNEIRLLKHINDDVAFLEREDPNQINKGDAYDVINILLNDLKYYDNYNMTLGYDELLKRCMIKKFEECKKTALNKYNSLIKHQKVTNGWHNVYFTDSMSYSCGIRSVYVLDDRVTIFKRFNGKEETVTSGGIISKQHSVISYYSLLPSGVFSNTRATDIYFID